MTFLSEVEKQKIISAVVNQALEVAIRNVRTGIDGLNDLTREQFKQTDRAKQYFLVLGNEHLQAIEILKGFKFK